MDKLSSLIDSFLENFQNRRGTSKFTIRNYRFYLKKFQDFAKTEKIDLELINQYKSYLAEKNLKPITQNYYLIALRGFLSYLKSEGIDTCSVELVKLLDAKPKVLEGVDVDEARRIMEGPDISKMEGLRDRAILEILFEGRLKPSEIVKLDIDCNLDLFWVNRYLSVRKDFFKPLFIRFSGKVQADQNGEKMRLSIRSIERIVEKYKKIAGVIDKRILSL